MSNRRATASADRRVHPRFPHAHPIQCRPLGGEADEFFPAFVEDISRTGLALLTHCQCRPGSVLALSLPGLSGRFERPLLVRVAHVGPTINNQWFAGCSFVKPLADHELQALLLLAQGL